MIAPGLLADRAAIVTGAGRGLGFAIAAELADQGASVVIAEIDPAAGPAAAAKICQRGGNAISVQTDVRDEGSVAGAVGQCLRTFGRVDILVNNASVITPVSIRKMTAEDWAAVLDVHLKGAWLTMRAVATPMRERSGGAIVNISSIVAKTGGVGQAHYAAAKSGMIGLTKSAAKEWGRHGIRVNAVQPGLFATAKARTMASSAWQKRISETPLGRAGEPRELASAVLFLASDLSSFITGAVLEVTGGRDL